jgi:hypothetical protein
LVMLTFRFAYSKSQQSTSPSLPTHLRPLSDLDMQETANDHT